MEVDDGDEIILRPAPQYEENTLIPQSAFEVAQTLTEDPNDLRKAEAMQTIRSTIARERFSTSEEWCNNLEYKSETNDFYFGSSRKRRALANGVNTSLGINEVQQYEIQPCKQAQHFEASEMPMWIDFRDFFLTVRAAAANKSSPFWMQQFGLSAAMVFETAVKGMRPGTHIAISNEKNLPDWALSALKAKQLERKEFSWSDITNK